MPAQHNAEWDGEQWDEMLEVRRRRYKEGRRAGLTIAEAKLFADCDTDIGLLRRLVALQCPDKWLPRIVL